MRRKQTKNLHLGPFRVPASASGIVMLVAGFVGGYFYCQSQTPDIFSSPTTIPALNVCFSPGGNCEAMAVGAINAAKESIYVRAYSFTSAPIANALMNAKSKGVKVAVLVDKSQLKENHTQIWNLQKLGIPIKIEKVSGLAHNKIILIDQHLIIGGSYNFSKSANSRNAENMTLINDQALAKTYLQNWQEANSTAHPVPNLSTDSVDMTVENHD